MEGGKSCVYPVIEYRVNARFSGRPHRPLWSILDYAYLTVGFGCAMRPLSLLFYAYLAVGAGEGGPLRVAGAASPSLTPRYFLTHPCDNKNSPGKLSPAGAV